MRRFLTLVCLLFLAIPAGITITGCYRNPAGNYCNGLGYGPKVTDLYTITLQPQTTGISMAFGQVQQMSAPQAENCKGGTVSVKRYAYGTTNNQLVDISPTGLMCAGTWNRNSGGGIPDYTICNFPNPLPNTNGLPFGSAYISASADSITSNPVQVFVHAQISSISLVGPQQCLSQGQIAQLNAQACYASNGAQVLMCAPSSVTSSQYACPLPPGVSSVPDCSSAIGVMSYTAGTSSVAQINPITNQITAELPGTTVITANIAQSGSTAGYFSTCPPQSISLSLNGSTNTTVTQGVPQNLVTKVVDTKGNTITGLTLDYQSTNPLNVTATPSGQVNPIFPGAGTVFAICQPGTCNPAPINQVGVSGTGLSISSNPVDITVPGTASSFVWYGAPGMSQYIIPVELLTGTVGSTSRLPYVPNSMVMDQTGTNIYLGSLHELMVYNTGSNQVTTQNPNLPGVVLAVSPTATQILVNDQVRKLFYIAAPNGVIASTQSGLGTSAQWTPDGKTLYVTDTSNAGPGHTDTLYVFNANTGWTTYPLVKGGTTGTQSVAITVPGVGAYISGDPTVAHTWCPTGNPSNYSSMVFYPQGDTVNADTDVLTATADGNHMLGAAAVGGGISFTDIGVTIPPGACPAAVAGILQPLVLTHTLNQTTINVNATAVDQVVSSPAAVTQGKGTPAYSLSFITYDGTTPGATLPYYKQTTGATSSLGTVGYLTLTGSSSITAPVAGAFSPDNTLFFVSTAGDNKVHYIDTKTLTDTQQISPNLPACAPGSDPNCKNTSPTTTVVPATAIVVKPRATT